MRRTAFSVEENGSLEVFGRRFDANHLVTHLTGAIHSVFVLQVHVFRNNDVSLATFFFAKADNSHRYLMG